MCFKQLTEEKLSKESLCYHSPPADPRGGEGYAEPWPGTGNSSILAFTCHLALPSPKWSALFSYLLESFSEDELVAITGVGAGRESSFVSVSRGCAAQPSTKTVLTTESSTGH